MTGFLEAEEDPKEAVVREVREELGIASTVESLVGVYPFSPKNEVIIAYHLKADGEITLDKTEIAEIKVVPKEELVPWGLGTGLAVADFIASLKNRSRL